MCGCNKEKVREQIRKEAKERIAQRKVEEGMCLTYQDLDGLSKTDRIKLAKNLCNREFR